MKKIVVIGIYFGQFPNNYNLWLKSCEYNSSIDFKVFTDQQVESNLKNLEYITINFDELRQLIKEKLGDQCNLVYPYKCCDFRPAYGIIFEDYIKGYDFWGHCDFDMIFGDIRKFITDDILDKYDKVLPLGHLSLYRNTIEVNNRYKEKGSICGNYEEVFSNPKNVAFDETNGIANIYYENNYPFYDEGIFANIAPNRKRFILLPPSYENHNNQVFYWEDGHVYRTYVEYDKTRTDEFVYIHISKRKKLKVLVNEKNNNFYISNKGFISKENGTPAMTDIMVYNRYYGIIYEKLEYTKIKIKRYLAKLKRMIKLFILKTWIVQVIFREKK